MIEKPESAERSSDAFANQHLFTSSSRLDDTSHGTGELVTDYLASLEPQDSSDSPKPSYLSLDQEPSEAAVGLDHLALMFAEASSASRGIESAISEVDRDLIPNHPWITQIERDPGIDSEADLLVDNGSPPEDVSSDPFPDLRFDLTNPLATLHTWTHVDHS